ncbi:transcriptional regulator [Gallibacterium anatis]|uniref:Cro/Cl family transcriptional regulator n=1 Tax=Gallibacterium anatis TaxID=750 RepID=A0A1A7P571_9PAST|nr:helix-turn-helix domain-containing protein [Gallibacterium anatis]OBW97178.1 Cro/Cl family transcriptional regulator [Gallibacterium anatis]OBW99298.1 Cro/Cl family transcriptional regulator [Gallibacterium anatis]OZN49972.1 Cro/Cl family transcriptional regulator [Gallibacterium anatis]
MNQGVQQSISICGSQAKLASYIGVSQNAISLWLKNGSKMDVKYIPLIIQATNGEVTARDLRPDVDWDTIKASL